MNRIKNRLSIRLLHWSFATSILAALSIAIGCTEQPSSPSSPTSPTASSLSTSRPAFLDELAGMEAGDSPLPPGERMPDLLAEGWLRGDAPSPGGLLGQVVVVEIWAHW